MDIYNIIIDLLDKLNYIINNLSYSEFELSINNNNYEIYVNKIICIYEILIYKLTSNLINIKHNILKYTEHKNTIIDKLNILLIDIENLNKDICKSKLIIENKDIKDIYEIDYQYIYQKFNNNFILDDNNLNILDINSIIHQKHNNNTDNNLELVDLGLNNYYNLDTYESINNIPFNKIVYIRNIKSVVIKVGNDKKYQYINAIIGKVPENSDKDNTRSIICNNNIKKYNKKCNNGINCNYYHDPIIGFPDIAHYVRQYSYNPLIYNCPNFKNGEKIKENCKNLKWEEGLNLYQSSLACILLGMIHSINC